MEEEVSIWKSEGTDTTYYPRNLAGSILTSWKLRFHLCKVGTLLHLCSCYESHRTSIKSILLSEVRPGTASQTLHRSIGWWVLKKWSFRTDHIKYNYLKLFHL